MTKRTVKKIANRYLDGGNVNRYIASVRDSVSVGCGYYVDEVVFRSTKLEHAILHEARLRGWDGCHWDNPLVIRVRQFD